MFSKLAFRNIKSQFRDYVVYFITLSIVVSLIFTLVNLLNSNLFKELFENSDNGNIYNIMITCLIVLFVGTLICYINSFLLSNRKKEFGLYLTCGMSKKNITTIFVIENLIVTLIATFVGCILGLIVFNITAISITNILGIEFHFSTYPIQSFLTTYLYTIIMFSFSMLLSAIYIKKVSIYNLINHKNKKRSINNKILIVALIVSLTTLLFTSISSKNILDSFEMIFLDDNNLLTKLSIYIILFFISIVFVCFSLLNLSLNTIIKIKSKSSKGISIFTLREIQDKISINSILIGILSVFMLISFISVCSATTIIKYTDELVEQQYPFDYSLYNIPESGYQFDGTLEEIKDKIDNKFTITDEYK
ncbi:MAG: FtsX-like permease family protein, partial [bacterium]